MSWKVAKRSLLMGKGPEVPKGAQSNGPPLGSPGDPACTGMEEKRKRPSIVIVRAVNIMIS